MKRRLFALLLTVVMVLGLAATAFAGTEPEVTEGPETTETPGTTDEPEATDEPGDAETDPQDEVNGEGEVKSEDETKTEDDANAEDDANVEDDANAEDEADTEGEVDTEDEAKTGGEAKTEGEVDTEGEVTNDADTEDDTGVEGEVIAQQAGEPQPLTGEDSVKVTVTGEVGDLVLKRLDGTLFESGKMVYREEPGFVLTVEGLPAHFTIRDASDNDNVWYDSESRMLHIYWDEQTPADGVTIEVVEEPYITVDLTDNTGLGLTVTLADGTPFQSGGKVYFAHLPDESYRPVLLVKKGSEIVKGLRFTVDSEREGEPLFTGYDAGNGIVSVFDESGDDYISMTIDLAPSVQIKLAGETDKLKSLTYLGEPVKDGDTIYSYFGEEEYATVTLDAVFTAGYGIERHDYYEAGNDFIYSNFPEDDVNAFINAEDGDCDGVVTLTVAKRPAVKLTITGAADKVKFTDPTGGTVKSGDMIYADRYLNVEIASGYGIPTSNYYSVDEGMFFVDTMNTMNRSEIVVQVMPYVTLNLAGEGVLGIEPYSYYEGEIEIKNGDQVLAGEGYSVSVKGGYTLEVTGGSVKQDEIRLDCHTGELTYWYVVTADGSGPVTVKGVASQQSLPVFKVKYVDADGAIDNEGNEYCMPDWGYIVMVKEGYTLSVEGGTAYPQGSGDKDENGTVWVPFVVSADEDATGMTVTSVKLTAGAVLKVNGSKDALVEKDPFDSEDVFCTDGDKLPSGRDYVLVKSGYAITDVKGGNAETYLLRYDNEKPGKSEIYTMYYVEATADTVTITVSPAAPNRWVKVNLVNNYADIEAYIYCDTDQDGNRWCTVSPNNPDKYDLAVNMYPVDRDTKLADYTVVGQGCSATQLDGYDSWVQYGVKADDGASEITVTVVKKDLQPELEVKVPDKPAAGVPGVPDKAAAEKQLMDTASAVVEAALLGKTPAGVSKADAAAIAKAAAEGKTITTQLEVKAVTAPADAAALKTAAGEDVIVQYVDIQIVVLADGEQIGHITETAQALDFAVVLSDEELAKGGIFYVIRAHDGTTSVLNAQLSGNVLSFSSDKFSTFAVANSNDIAFAEVAAIADQTWTGGEIKPAVKVTVNGSKTLTEGVDYTVSYKNNVNTGTATVVITGIGAYTGTKEVTFRIVAPAKPAGTSAPGTAPATGDGTPLALYAGLLALSAAGLVLVLGRKKRTEK